MLASISARSCVTEKKSVLVVGLRFAQALRQLLATVLPSEN